MLLLDERQAVADYCRAMLKSGLTTGTGGNISIRCGEYAAISPSAVPYEGMSAEDVPVVRISDSAVVEGERKPSSEIEMHLLVYRKRGDVGAVVHTHSPAATALACLGEEIPPVHYLLGFAGKTVPCIPYYPFGSLQLAEAASDALKDGQNGVLLGNHGLLCCGKDISAAFAAAEHTEFVSDIYLKMLASGRKPKLLSDEQMEQALLLLGNYGK